MAIIWTKGAEYAASFEAQDFPVLTSDWTGVATITPSGSIVATRSWTLTRVSNAMNLSVSIDDILNLLSGEYVMKVTLSNTVLGLSVSSAYYITVVPALAAMADRTVISMTVAKIDGTPAGRESKELTNTGDGMQTMLVWDGVTVTASHAVADDVLGIIVGTETISTKTNAAGYAQLSVIKGQTVVVSCPAFGTSVTVDTTGQDSIDLSSYF